MLRRRGIQIALGCVLLALVVATTWFLTRPDSADVTDRAAVTDADVASTTTAGEPGCDSAIVYVDAGAPPEDVESIGRALRAVPGVVAANYADRDESYAAFEMLFAEDPEIVQSMAPDELPTSYRVGIGGSDPASTVAALEELDLPGIYKVDSVCGSPICRTALVHLRAGVTSDELDEAVSAIEAVPGVSTVSGSDPTLPVTVEFSSVGQRSQATATLRELDHPAIDHLQLPDPAWCEPG